MSKREIIHAYRNLYRTSLHAIRYSKPARYTLLAHLRTSFRTTPASAFNSRAISNTIEFLHNAATYQGLEQNVVKNLLFVWRSREKAVLPVSMKASKQDRAFRDDAYAAFDRDLDMLQRTLGICLK